MIVALQHTFPPGQKDVTELHCSQEEASRVSRALYRLTGSVTQPLFFGCEVVFRTRALTLDQGCALLQLVTRERINPAFISWELIERTIERGQEPSACRYDLDVLNCPCAQCRLVANLSGHRDGQ